ncbi:MAG TPA: TonB-dependent receptor [Mucilaginibacter sp.]|jgi:outer membrane receptor protein involved in Fe transport|nr:TonB-dependent receptor [Mucilaginibacter sp.]
MKRFYILIAILCSFITANAQFGGGSTIVGKISGTLVDSLSKKPLDYASVGLYRSGGKNPITGVITDEKGNFKLNDIHPGSYKLVITFIGYPNKTVDPIVTTDSKPDKNLGLIIVAPGAKTLKEVVITGQAALVENHIDKLVYNVEKDLTAAGGNASDVLQKVPLVSVDLNGNVAIRGDQNVKVLINGKPSGATSASLSDVLKTIPADQIKSIEVITSPSAKYDAEGSAGILNIVTKQKNMTGISGSVSGGIGTRQNNGNFNLNYNKNRFSLSINAGGNLTWPQTTITDFNQDFQGTNSHNGLDVQGTSLVKRYGTISSATANYEFNAFNSISTTFRFNKGGFNTNGNNTTTKTNFIHTDSSYMYDGNSLGHNSFGGFDWSMDYTHKFSKDGEHNIVFSGQWSHSSIVTDYSTLFTPELQTNQQNNINGINNEYTMQADYTYPVNKVFKVEAGGKEIIRRINSTSAEFDPLGTSGFVYDPYYSSSYNYNQNVTAGYTVFTFTLPKKYSILAGARVENTAIHGDPMSQSQTNLQPFDNNYLTFVPSLTIQDAISSTQTVKLSYSKRITRPSLQYLNPFVNSSNVTALTEGNPNLAPEVSQTIELNYNTFVKSSVFNMSVYYKHIDGLIEGILDTSHVKGKPVTLSDYQNAGVNNSIGASFFGSINPIKILTIRTSINVYTFNPTPYAAYIKDFTSTGIYVQYNAFLSASVNLKNDFVAEMFAVENSPRRTIQGPSASFSILGFGVKKQILKKKASIGLNTIEPFSKYKDFNSNISSPGFTQSSRFQFPFRSVGLTFGYSFGKTTFSNPQEKKKGVNNDDLKQGDQGGMPSGGR